MYFKKIIAISAIAALTLSPISTVSAASYAETEKSLFTSSMASFSESYDKEMASVNDPSSVSLNLTLTPSESGMMILNLLSEIDVSWAKALSLTGTVTLDGNQEYIVGDIILNDTKLCTFEILIKTDTADILMRVPELSESYLSVSVDASGEVLNQADVQTLIGILPDSKTIETLLDRYVSILLNHISNSEEQKTTLTAGSLSKEASVLEGIYTVENGVPMFEELLKAAKDDQELKSLFDSVESVFPETEGTYEELHSYIDPMLAELPGLTEEEDLKSEQIYSRLFTDSEGKVLGRSFGLSAFSEDIVNYVFLKDGDSAALDFTFKMDDVKLALQGEGTSQAGSYKLSLSDSEILTMNTSNIAITEDTASGEALFALSPGFGTIVDEESYEMLSSFNIKTFFDLKESGGTLGLSLLSSDVSFADLMLEAYEIELVEIPEINSEISVYDMDSSEDLDAYMATINLEGLLSTVQSAGVPEELLEGIL